MTGANAIQILLIAGIFGQFFLGALYLQKVRHFTAIEVGLAFLPIAIGIGLLSVTVAPRLIMRRGPRAGDGRRSGAARRRAHPARPGAG